MDERTTNNSIVYIPLMIKRIQNKSGLIKQVKGISSMINNSSAYWKETFNEFENNFCQCGSNTENADSKIEANLNPDGDGNNNYLSDIVMQKRINNVFTDKRSGNCM